MSSVSIGGGSIEDQTVSGARPDTAGSIIFPSSDDDLNIKFKIGGIVVNGRLPLIPTALSYVNGFNAARDAALKDDVWDEVLFAAAASIGLCWQGLNAGDFRRTHRRDIIAYGEAVIHALMKSGVKQFEIARVAEELKEAIADSIPTMQEVNEEREDFTVPLPDSSEEGQPEADPAVAPE